MKKTMVFFLRPVMIWAGCMLLVSFVAAAQSYTFDYNARCKQAYDAMLSLRISEANVLLQKELADHPNNLIPVMIADYGDCITLLFNGDAGEYRKRKNNMENRLALIDKGDAKSPWYRYAKANIYFHWAAIHMRFEENFAAGSEFRRSYQYLKDNQKLFPGFKYNQVLMGLEEAIVGTVPEKYKWLSNMLGLKGSVKGGTAKIVNFLNTRDGSTAQMRQEAVFYYCYLKFYLLSEKEEVWKYLKASDLDVTTNQLYSFMKANLALNDNKAALAEQTLNSVTKSPAYLNPPLLHYLRGNALLLKMDEDCVSAYQQFLSRYRGKIFVKDAYQKISLYYYAGGNTEQGDSYRSKIAGAGSVLIDADKQAQRFANAGVAPNATLLKARLYSDGGYFEKALALLRSGEGSMTSDADRLEYAYRLGKVYQLTGDINQAVSQLEIALRLGANRPEQYGARAALELGQIYERLGKTSQAISYYRRCVAMKDHDFESSLEQKAKAGINRLGGS